VVGCGVLRLKCIIYGTMFIKNLGIASAGHWPSFTFAQGLYITMCLLCLLYLVGYGGRGLDLYIDLTTKLLGGSAVQTKSM
jgi:hypothetical protein